MIRTFSFTTDTPATQVSANPVIVNVGHNGSSSAVAALSGVVGYFRDKEYLKKDGSLAAEQLKIIQSPQDALDATNREYVDLQIRSHSHDDYLSIEGGTVNGDVTVRGHFYTDSLKVGGGVEIGGGLFLHELSIHHIDTNKISIANTPVDSNDGVPFWIVKEIFDAIQSAHDLDDLQKRIARMRRIHRV